MTIDYMKADRLVSNSPLSEQRVAGINKSADRRLPVGSQKITANSVDLQNSSALV